MPNQVFFLHSAGQQGPHEGSSDFVAWIRKNLGSTYEVLHPAMPHPEDPEYEPWKGRLDHELQGLNDELIVVGHSLGGSVLLKYLTEVPMSYRIKAFFAVATPFWGSDAGWQHEPFTLPAILAERLPQIEHIFFYHSKGDPFVPVEHVRLYAQELPQATVREIEGSDHGFTNGLPQLAQDIRSL